MTAPQHQEPRPALSEWSDLVQSCAAFLVATVVIVFAVNAEAASARSNERQPELRVQNQNVPERIQSSRLIVPSLSGMRPEEARQALSDPRYRRLLSLGNVEQRESDRAEGTIIGQTPGAGTQVARATAIGIVVAQAPNVIVPSLSGMRPEEARQALSDPRYRRLLSLGNVEQRESDRAEGTIIGQTPGAGTQVARATAIGIVVAQAPNVIVPSLSGMRPEEARQALSDPRYRRLLSLGNVEQRESDRAEGTIIGQTPGAGTQVTRATAIGIVVAQAPNVIVPSLSGMRPEEARQALSDPRYRRLLSLGNVEQRESDRAEGTIIGQTPGAGTQVTRATAIGIVVAQAPNVIVPSLSGMRPEEARQALSDPRYRRLLSLGNVEQRESDRAEGTIIGQTPGAGTQVARATAIGIVVAQAPNVIVPSLSGMRPEEARQALSDPRYRRLLSLGNVEQRESDRAEGTIIGQTPGAGTQVTRATAIGIVVAQAPNVIVPSLSGMRPEEARQALSDPRYRRLLSLGNVEQRESDRAEGTIIGQTPGAGTQVARATAIGIVVAAQIRVVPPGLESTFLGWLSQAEHWTWIGILAGALLLVAALTSYLRDILRTSPTLAFRGYADRGSQDLKKDTSIGLSIRILRDPGQQELVITHE